MYSNLFKFTHNDSFLNLQLKFLLLNHAVITA